MIGTDHAPHTLEEKSQPYPQSPSGLPAIENSLALILDRVVAGKCSINQVASWMSDAPARVWGMVGKGRIEPGYDADLVLVDLERVKTIRDEDQITKCRWSPWHGETLTGWPVATFVGGRQIWSHADGFDDIGAGQKLVFDHARGGFLGYSGRNWTSVILRHSRTRLILAVAIIDVVSSFSYGAFPCEIRGLFDVDFLAVLHQCHCG